MNNERLRGNDMAVGDIPNWFTALLGVVAGAGVTTGRDVWANRPRLQYGLGTVRERVWLELPRTGPPKATTRAKGQFLLVTIDLLFVNSSSQDNAVLESSLSLSERDPPLKGL